MCVCCKSRTHIHRGRTPTLAALLCTQLARLVVRCRPISPSLPRPAVTSLLFQDPPGEALWEALLKPDRNRNALSCFILNTGGTTNRVLIGCVVTIDTSLATSIGHSGLCQAYSSKSLAHALIPGCPYPFGEQAATRRDS
eukprot:1264049-Rhodomonas_salina.1